MIPTEVGSVVREQIKKMYVPDIYVGDIHIERRLQIWEKDYCQ